MTRPQYFTHRDANQGEIVQGLRDMGAFVFDISPLCPWADIAVWWYDDNLGARRWGFYELKTATGRLTEGEQAMLDEWPGAVMVARCVEDVCREYGRC